MTARPVAEYLADFCPQPLAETLSEIRHGDPCLDVTDAPAEDDPLTLIQKARDEALTEGYAAAHAEYEARLLQDNLAFEARLAAERERWTHQESERLSEDIKAAIAVAQSNIAGSVERILTPFVAGALRHRMADLLAENIGVLLGGKEQSVIEIHGPEDLLAMLREKLAAITGAIGYFPDDLIDVRIVAGQTMIESRIEAWLERIKSLPE